MEAVCDNWELTYFIICYPSWREHNLRYVVSQYLRDVICLSPLYIYRGVRPVVQKVLPRVY